MKTYFILRDFLDECLKNSVSTGLSMKSYKIDGVETLTNDFFIDNQVVSADPIASYGFCNANDQGTSLVATTDPVLVNSYNPFSKHLGTDFNLVNGLKRGMPIGTLNGKDYGQGVLKIGVDKPKVQDGGGTLVKGAFFIDIDYEKNLEIEFDVLTNIINGSVYEVPQLFRKYKIIWNKDTCKKEFSYYSYQTLQTYQDFGYGFLIGSLSDFDGADYTYHIDFDEIECGSTGTECFDKERTISYALFVEIPKATEPAETIKECCYQAEVFAQIDGSDDDKNDYSGFWHKKQVPNETANFFLVDLGNNEETALNNNTYGTFKNFGSIPDNSDLKTFVLQWKKVLELKGEGSYTVLKRVTIAGTNYEEADINYNLKSWSVSKADKTVRIDIRTNGLMERLGVDFVNSNFETSLRFGGFFGRREPKYEEDNIIYSNFVSEQISMMQTNEYTLQSNLLPSCMTQPIIDFLLFANDIYLNDYNLNNHLRNFIKFPVKFEENKGTGYFNTTTKAVLNLTFSDKKVNNIKRNY